MSVCRLICIGESCGATFDVDPVRAPVYCKRCGSELVEIPMDEHQSSPDDGGDGWPEPATAPLGESGADTDRTTRRE